MPSTKDQEQSTKEAMKEQRARDAAQAMREYEAERIAVRARTERLRALRLAHEAATAAQPAPKRTKGKR